MTDQKETSATMWQDRYSGKRGHQLMTKKLADAIPALYANESVPDYDTVLAHAKLFSPFSNWTWFITEMDPATGTCFGLVDGLEKEIGYFDLTELAETLGEIKNGSQGNSSHGQETGKGETMTDDNEMEVHGPDVVNVEEFLFGGVTEETADDAPADSDGELPTAEAGGDASDCETADEPDADDAAEEPDVADDAGEQAVPAETETTGELKVVLSAKGGRGIIGVQQPSADPHIESFDGLDLLGLALQVPQVVERARARWEEEPRYPAYEKPAPPARRQRQRRQAPVEAATEQGAGQDANAEGAAEQEEAQQTLRLF